MLVQTIENKAVGDQAGLSDLSQLAIRLMTSGGDERISLNPDTGLNRYLTAPMPDRALAYSSSTANSISPAAFGEVQRLLATVAPDGLIGAEAYAEQLELLRERLRQTYRLPANVQIVFAASGTDLEYVGLAVARREERPVIDNIILGLNEIGSGCVNSAKALHFAHETPLGHAVVPGQPIDPVLASQTRLVDIEMRNANGLALPSEDVLLDVGLAIERALNGNRQPLLHIVHGSKTGLIAPCMDHIDALRRRYGRDLSMVVDACQARISPEMITAYLARGITVFLTGSKFMGGPPFSGMALVPDTAYRRVAPLDQGMARIFARAEWPADWPGRAALPDQSNIGLLLRLTASIFELDLYSRLSQGEVRRTLDLFDDAITTLTRATGATRARIAALSSWDSQAVPPLEMRTLVTLDLSESGRASHFEDARRLYQWLAHGGAGGRVGRRGVRPIRLGQPVQCLRLPDGQYAGVLRIGLSMPQMVEFAAMDSSSLRERLNGDMAMIASAIMGWN